MIIQIVFCVVVKWLVFILFLVYRGGTVVTLTD